MNETDWKGLGHVVSERNFSVLGHSDFQVKFLDSVLKYALLFQMVTFQKKAKKLPADLSDLRWIWNLWQILVKDLFQP